VAPNEPYTAFDYVELSTTALVVPEPGPLALVALMGALAGSYRIARRRKADRPAAA
jgi:hypothetical protein